jgi:hypothetical protein
MIIILSRVGVIIRNKILGHRYYLSTSSLGRLVNNRPED